MEKGLISVIVPVYNSEAFLEKCIYSILSQSYANIEIVLIDDGSTDSSSIICDSFVKKNRNIKCIHQKNQGVSVARNVGIESSRGEFLCFIDSDDVVTKDYIQHLFSLMDDGKNDWALTAVENYRCFESGERIALNFSCLNPEAFLLLNREYVLYGPVCKLYKSEIVKKYNLSFPENINYGEDLIFNFTYMQKIKTAMFLNVNDYLYDRNHTESLSTKYRRTMFEEEIMLAGIKKSFFVEKGVYNREFEKLLHEGIFDMGYNAILKTYFMHDNPNIVMYVSKILNNSHFQEAVNDIPNGKYSNIILFLMKKKHVQLLLLYLHLREER